jgi:hypothetical protein
MRRWVVAVALLVAGARPSPADAAATDRFVTWLAAHPEVTTVTVSSDAGPLEPFATRFRVAPKTRVPPGARVRIVDPRGSLICVTRPPAHVCVRGPAAKHLWSDDELSREKVGRWDAVLMLGPLPDQRAAVYSLRLPEAIVRSGEPARMNPRWVDPPHQGPWWAFEYDGPVLGTRAALKKASPVPAATDVPDWLDDATGFSAFVTGDPKVFRLQTATDVGLCVRGAAGWVCRPLPPISLDEIHPGLPRTFPGLPPQLPVIYAAQAASQGDLIAVAIERSWVRSKNAHTPSLEWAGAFVEIVELRPGATAFARRATLELTSGRLTDFADSHSGFPAVDALSLRPPKQAWCIDVVASGIIPPKMRTAPLGRYCVNAEGRLALEPALPEIPKTAAPDSGSRPR